MICDLTFISQTGSFTLQSPRSSCTSSSNTRTWTSSSASALLQVSHQCTSLPTLIPNPTFVLGLVLTHIGLLQVNRGSTLWSGTGGTSPSLEQVLQCSSCTLHPAPCTLHPAPPVHLTLLHHQHLHLKHKRTPRYDVAG